MTGQINVAEIGLLVYPGAQMAAVHGLTDLFSVANRIVREQPMANVPLLRISHWSATVPGAPIERIFDSQPELTSRPVAVLIPPSLDTLP